MDTLRAFQNLGDSETFDQALQEIDYQTMGFNQSLFISDSIGTDKEIALSQFSKSGQNKMNNGKTSNLPSEMGLDESMDKFGPMVI